MRVHLPKRATMRPVPAKTPAVVQNGVGKWWGKGGYGLIFAIKGLENGGILRGGGVERR